MRHTQTGKSVVRVSVNFSQSLLCSGTSPAASLEAALQRCALCAVIPVSASQHAIPAPCTMFSHLGGGRPLNIGSVDWQDAHALFAAQVSLLKSASCCCRSRSSWWEYGKGAWRGMNDPCTAQRQ